MVEIFVFGSNSAGRHGRGAALFARQHHGAIYGQGVGPQGRAYAIPTKDWRIATLPLPEIAEHVRDFLEYAAKHPEMTFNVTEVACGLAGYKPAQIAPFFSGFSKNVILPQSFIEVLLLNIRMKYYLHNPNQDYKMSDARAVERAAIAQMLAPSLFREDD